MIRGFGGSGVTHDFSHPRSIPASTLPMPFNIPNVLHNLLFKDVGITFDSKQSDLKETLVFSYKALAKMEVSSAQSEQETRAKILNNPDNNLYKDELEEILLDRLEANAHYKDLVIVMSDLLSAQQYSRLLTYSGIPV